MTRTQRRWHLYVWLTLGPLTMLGLLVALRARPAIPAQPEIRVPSERAAAPLRSSAAEDKP